MPCSLRSATISHIFLIDGSAVSLNHETASGPQLLVENGGQGRWEFSHAYASSRQVWRLRMSV